MLIYPSIHALSKIILPSYHIVLQLKEVMNLGMQRCNCGATAIGSSTTTIQIGSFVVSLNLEVDINICPNCTLAGSFVNVSLSAIFPPGSRVTATFTGTAAGLPICTEENGVQTLVVEVEGHVALNNTTSQLINFPLKLVSTNQVCIDLDFLGFSLPCLTVPVVFTC
jgi:hypothetical protein